jgi:hypothetical protein
MRRLRGLAARVLGGLADGADFRRARAEVGALPLPTAEVDVALSRLEVARRRLLDDDPVAAACVLRLLAASLCPAVFAAIAEQSHRREPPWPCPLCACPHP